MTIGNRVRNATLVAAGAGLLAASMLAMPASAEVVINEAVHFPTATQHESARATSVSPVHYLGWYRQ